MQSSLSTARFDAFPDDSVKDQFLDFQKTFLPMLLEQEKQKRGDDFFRMSEAQKHKFYGEMDQILKSNYDSHSSRKQDILITTPADLPFQAFAPPTHSLNQSSLFNDSKFVPLEPLLSAPFDESKHSTGTFHNPNFLPKDQEGIQAHLIQQYEQVMQLMHNEIQKLILQNKDLQDQQSLQRQFSLGQDQSLQHMQNQMQQKEELIESLRQREQVIFALRQELDKQSSTVIDLQSRLESFQHQGLPKSQQSDQQLRFKIDQLSERNRKLELQANQKEQDSFEMEQQNLSLKRDNKHFSLSNEQLKQELQEVNRKRDIAEGVSNELKTKVCQNLIQIKQLTSALDQQRREAVGLQNQILQLEKVAEQANFECEQTKVALHEADAVKLAQFQALQSKDREIQNLRSLGRRFYSLIEAHKESFGELADVNYDALFREVQHTNLSFQPSQVSLAHIPVQRERVDFNLPPPIKFKQALPEPGEDYYQMLDQLSSYVRQQQTASHMNSARSPPRTSQDFEPKQRSILKNSQTFAQKEEESAPAISWLSGSASQTSVVSKAKETGKKVNVEGLKSTLASLLEEKKSLEQQLRSGHSMKSSEDLKFEIEVAGNSIKRIQEKIAQAQ